MLSLVISLAGIPFSATAGQQSWSVDLSAYGPRRERMDDGRNHDPIILVAATNRVVAVAWGNPPHAANGTIA
jgi:hypothetical protein